MKKDKKKWTNFKRIFSKAPNKAPAPSINPTSQARKTRPKEIFVIESTEEETFKVGSKSKEVFVIEPAQGETFILEATEEETVDFKPESESNDILVIEPTKEYETLGLDSDASDAEVKTRYRELLKEHHPDMGGDPKKFMKIRKAYVKIKESRAEGET
jgi:DnaJ-domain-containing protein 1